MIQTPYNLWDRRVEPGWTKPSEVNAACLPLSPAWPAAAIPPWVTVSASQLGEEAGEGLMASGPRASLSITEFLAKETRRGILKETD